MYRYYGWNGFSALPDDVIAFAWSAPMRELGPKIGISDVALRKMFVSLGVTVPPQGHWNRVHAGRQVPEPPSFPPRRPGQTGRLEIDHRFAPFIAKADPIPSTGPFATRAVAEDLEELRVFELKAIGKASVSRTFEPLAPGLRKIIASEDLLRQKDAESHWHWDPPRFDNPLDQRRLRLLNAIFLTLAKRGHSGEASEHDHEIRPSAMIGDTDLSLTLEIIGKHRTVMVQGQRRPTPDLPASTTLALSIAGRPGSGPIQVWQDDADGKLETKIAVIVAGLVVAGEAKFREQLRLDEEQAERDRIEREDKSERERIEREQRLIARLAEMNRQRIADLQKSGEMLRLSRDIRALIEMVGGSLAGRTDVDAATIDAWKRWASEEADKLDPILSGQVLSHLRPPRLDTEETS